MGLKLGQTLVGPFLKFFSIFYPCASCRQDKLCVSDFVAGFNFSNLKRLFGVYVYKYVCAPHVPGTHEVQKKVLVAPKTVVTGGCEPPSRGDEN